jgi:hypothetical protein
VGTGRNRYPCGPVFTAYRGKPVGSHRFLKPWIGSLDPYCLHFISLASVEISAGKRQLRAHQICIVYWPMGNGLQYYQFFFLKFYSTTSTYRRGTHPTWRFITDGDRASMGFGPAGRISSLVLQVARCRRPCPNQKHG